MPEPVNMGDCNDYNMLDPNGKNTAGACIALITE